MAIEFSACQDDPVQFPARKPRELTGFVTGEAAANIGPDGSYALINTNAGLSGREEIKGPQAAVLATAWVRDYARWVQGYLSRTHGSPVEVAELTACGRPLYAASPFEPLPDDLPSPNHKGYGPYWLITLCGAAGVPQVLLAVSAYNTDVLDNAGRHRPVTHGGGEYAWVGIPGGRLDVIVASPEEATRMVGERTGAVVRATPQLFIGAKGPWTSSWRLELDGTASVNVRATGRSVQTAELYVVRLTSNDESSVSSPTIAVPSSDQPEGVTFRYVMPFTLDRREPLTLTYGTATARRRPDVPLRFDPVATSSEAR
jgi:hypothetical protein